MKRIRIIIGLLATLVVSQSAAMGQTIASPSQSDLLSLAFVDFIDNAEDDMAALQNLEAVGSDAVRVTFKTDYDTNDDLYRVAIESPITADLTGLNAFSLTFSDSVIAPSGISQITSQLFVRSAGGDVFTGNGQAITLGSAPTTLSITPDQISGLGGDPSDITSFGIEFFGGDEFLGGLDGAMVTLSTSPEPPNLVDTVLFSWENGADPQGWDAPPITAGAHTVQVRQGSPAIGASEGNNALQITRHPTENNFEWGSAYTLDAFANSADTTGDYSNNGTVGVEDYTIWRDAQGTNAVLPNRDANSTGDVSEADYDAWKANFGAVAGGDPAVQAEITALAEMLNDPDAYAIAFDVTVEDQFPNDNPGYLILHMAVAADGGPDNAGDVFFQNDAGAVPAASLGAGEPVTVELLLSQFVDVAPESDTNGQSLAEVGLYDETGFLTLHLASNLDLLSEDFVFTIDNLRIRSIAPEMANLAGAAVPEPGTFALLAFVSVGLAAARRGFRS